MPLYEYRCRDCDDVFELKRTMAESSAPATCPAGHPGAVRLLSVFAATGRASGSGSAEPSMAGAPSVGCGGGCMCH